MSATDPILAFGLGILITLVAGYLWLQFRWPSSRRGAAAPPAGTLVDPPDPIERAAPDPEPTAPSRRRAPIVVSSSTLLLSERVILHLDRFGRSSQQGLAPFHLCQQGMVEHLNVRQSALTKVLQRLAAAGALVESTEHVQGQSRRRKVYRLTTLGHLLAKDLRARTPNSPTVTVAR